MSYTVMGFERKGTWRMWDVLKNQVGYPKELRADWNLKDEQWESRRTCGYLGASGLDGRCSKYKSHETGSQNEWCFYGGRVDKAGRSQMEETLFRTLIFNLKSIRNLWRILSTCLVESDLHTDLFKDWTWLKRLSTNARRRTICETKKD